MRFKYNQEVVDYYMLRIVVPIWLLMIVVYMILYYTIW